MPMASRSAECLITFPSTPGNARAGCSNSCWVPSVRCEADIPGSAPMAHLPSTFCFSLSAAGCSPHRARWPRPPMTSSSLKASCPFDSQASGAFQAYRSTAQTPGSLFCTCLPASLPSCCVTLSRVTQKAPWSDGRHPHPGNDSCISSSLTHCLKVASSSANCPQ